MTTIAEIKSTVTGMDENSVRELISIAMRELKKRSQQKAFALRTARRVRFIGNNSTRLQNGVEGVLEKVNSRTASVDFGSLGHWRIDCVFLEVVA